MGWWGHDVLGGDEPLDDLYDYEQKLGVDELYSPSRWDDAKRQSVRDAINADQDGYLKLASSENEVMMQVGAVVLMCAGAEMTDAFRKAAIKAGEEDLWAKEDDEERVRKMEEFVDTVKEYDGTPVKYTTEGLMSKFAKAGLI